VARFRGDQLRRLIARKNLDFRRSLVGRDLEVLVLDGTPISGSRPGLSDNFVRVSVPDHLEPGQWRRVWVTRIEGDGLRAVC
jgi:tRNA A37 methylthiotransferase MiaB